MPLTGVSLQHFRNYAKKTVSFSTETTVISGENAKGKTNLLEGVFLLSTGDSFRAQRTEEMIQLGHGLGRVGGSVMDGKGNETHVEIILTNGKVQGKQTLKRQYRVDGAPKRKRDAVGLFHCVLFHPEDMDLIAGSPSLRRRFLDTALSQMDWKYAESLMSYEKALKRRNALLDLLRDGRTTRESFSFWDQLLIRHGNILTEKRRKFMEFFSGVAAFPKMKTAIQYDASTVSDKRLEQYRDAEVAAGYTLVGPHKDDFRVLLQNGETDKDLALFGSRGEQRMGVLWLKLGELQYYEVTGLDRPLLLLDDIFSELDEKHRQMILEVVGRQQTIITTTEENTALFGGMKFDMMQV